jgi:transcriptional regulator with XRE-family HTH domain
MTHILAKFCYTSKQYFAIAKSYD